MKRTYRYIAVALALAIATVSFTSCGSDKAETSTDVALATISAEQVQTQVVTDKQGNTQIVTVPNTTAVAKQNEAKATQKQAVQQQATQKQAVQQQATQKVAQQNNQPKATQKQAVQQQNNQPKATQKATQKQTQKQQPKTTQKEEWKDISDEDVAWVTKKANEYIASLPKCQLDTSLTPQNTGWNVRTGFPFNMTREQYWQYVKDDIQYEYEDLILYEGWERLYFVPEKINGGWEYYILYA